MVEIERFAYSKFSMFNLRFQNISRNVMDKMITFIIKNIRFFQLNVYLIEITDILLNNNNS